MTARTRLALYIIGGVIVGAVLFWLALTFDPFGRRKRAELWADSAEVAETIATNTAKITERTFTKETIIREKGEAVVQTIEAAPGADTPIPPDVLSAWADGIGRLRDDTGAGSDPRSTRPLRTMPAPVT